jgi:hypothetical protein
MLILQRERHVMRVKDLERKKERVCEGVERERKKRKEGE